MNSSESSVIVLDSDDEEDQSNRHSSKNTDPKANVSKISSQSTPPSLQNVRSGVTLSSNQYGKVKIATTPQPSLLTKSVSSFSITPISQLQNQKSAASTNNNQNSKNSLLKISPKNSPRNSPKAMTNSGIHSSGSLNSGMSHRKSPTNVGNLAAKGKPNFENRSVNNNETTSRESSKYLKIGSNNNPHLNLKRKLDNHTENTGLSTSNQIGQKALNYKRIKPTTISNTVNWCPKWSQSTNTITIDDDDDDGDYFDNTSKTNKSTIINKSRSNSITSSSAVSPSPSSSSMATSPQSQNSPATSSPSIKDLSRRSSTPKGLTGNSTEIAENLSDNSKLLTSTLLDKGQSEAMISEKSKDLQLSSNSPIPNGNLSVENKIEEKQKNEIIPAFEQLIEACRKSENSGDMELLIERKLLKYYHSIHPDFITSKSFKKIVENITTEILEAPNLVYIKLKTIIEELKSRKNSKVIVVSNDGQTSTGNDEVDEKVRQLNKGLRKLKHMIAKMEEEEVDWDCEFSSYLKVEKFKKRACEIYEKICDLTGESKHAQRAVRKPIVFDHTAYPKINKAIETFVNKTKTFPDFHDILTILQHCNKNYNLDLTSEELKRIAQDAFVKVGKLLQNRRKTDLYETLSHYEKNKDPALEDTDLSAKLNENKKYYGKINALIQKYAREQDTIQSEKLKAKEETRKTDINVDSLEKCNDNNNDKSSAKNLTDFKKEDERFKESEIIDEKRNTPSCSYNLQYNNNQDRTEKDKNNDGDKNENFDTSKISKNCIMIKETSNNSNSNTNNNNNNSNVNSNSKNIESKNLSNVNSIETVKANAGNNSRTPNQNNDNKPTLKIVSVTSLCEKSKINSSSLAIQSSSKNNSSSKKSTNIKKPLLDFSLNKNKTNIDKINRQIEFDEIILSDDDV